MWGGGATGGLTYVASGEGRDEIVLGCWDGEAADLVT